MTKKALLVGINYLNDPSVRLQGCIDDIVNISKILVDEYDYPKENVVQLRDDFTEANKKPTRTNILRELTVLVEQSSTLSEIWFHYSGHGSQIRDLNRDEWDGLDEVIVPSDFRSAGLIVDDEIFNIIKNTKCKTILLFDSCHSSSVCDLQWSFEYNYNGGFIKTQNNIKKIDNPYVFSISGCKDNQTSADSYSVEQKEAVGAFTDAFIHCLRENNYSVNIIKLYADVCAYIRQEGFSQKPILSCSSMIPSYIFIKTKLQLPSPAPTPTPGKSPIVPPGQPVKASSALKDNVVFTFNTNKTAHKNAMNLIQSNPVEKINPTEDTRSPVFALSQQNNKKKPAMGLLMVG